MKFLIIYKLYQLMYNATNVSKAKKWPEEGKNKNNKLNVLYEGCKEL